MNGNPSATSIAEQPTEGGVALANAAITAAQWEVIDLCVQTTKLLGMPRSIGEIFGLVFSSSSPLTFDDVVALLRISAGSASHGLRFLRRIGAVRLAYVARDRRDFYVPELSLKRLLGGYLAEIASHHLGDTQERLNRLETILSSQSELPSSGLRERVATLLDWNRQARAAVTSALGALPS